MMHRLRTQPVTGLDYSRRDVYVEIFKFKVIRSTLTICAMERLEIKKS